MAKCALYRHFDKDGALLYVGISYNPFKRTGNHVFNAGWFGDVSRIDIEWHATREKALWFEELAIAKENPKYNSMRPAGIVDGSESEPARKGIRARKPEVQQEIDAIIQEAATLGHKLKRNSCLAVVQHQIGLIKDGKSPHF